MLRIREISENKSKYTPWNAPLRVRRRWGRLGARARQRMRPLREEIAALRESLDKCVFELNNKTKRTKNYNPPSEYKNSPTWIPPFQSYYNRVPMGNPELLSVDNPGYKYGFSNKGGKKVRRIVKRRKVRRTRRRNAPLTVSYGGKLHTWRALTKKHGVMGAKKIWRSRKKHHGYAKRAVRPFRKKRKAANPRNRYGRSRKRARNAPLKVAYGGQKVTWRTLTKRLGVRGAAKYWRGKRKYHYGKGVNPRKRRKRRSRRGFRRKRYRN